MRLPLVRVFRWLCFGMSVIMAGLAVAAYWQRARLLHALSIAIEDLHAYTRDVRADIRRLLAPRERWKPAILGAFFVMALLLRIAALDAPMRYDESYTFNNHSSRDALNIISDYTTPNNHILQSVLVHISFKLFGNSPIALRLPALLAGILLIPVTFWTVRRLLDDVAGLVGAGLVALSGPLISYSANARGYTLLTLLFLAGFALATRLVEKRSLTAWALFVAVSVLGFFTIPVMVYGFAVVSMWMLLSSPPERRKPLLIELFIASVFVASISVLLYFPAAIRCGVQNLVANPFVRPLPFPVWWTHFPQLPASFARYAVGSFPIAIQVLLFVGLAASVFLHGDRGKRARRLHAAILLTIPPMIVLQQVVPFLRVLIFLLPLYYGLAVVGLHGLLDFVPPSPASRCKRPVFAAAALLMALLGGLQLYTKTPQHGIFADLPYVIEGLKPLLGDGDRVVASIPLSEPLRYHAERMGLPRRAIHEFEGYWGDRQLNHYKTIYFVEEKNPPRRSFVSFRVESVRVSDPAFAKYFGPPERVGQSDYTTWYRLRRKSDETQTP